MTDIETIDDLVRQATEKIAQRDGPAIALRAGAKLRAVLALKRPGTMVEAQALAEAHLRDGDR
jgi:hypothetical protein